MNTDKAPSRFITFEGIDRCGKTTQTKLLKRQLDQQQIRCLVTAEPGGSGTLGTQLRDLLLDPEIERHELTAALLFSADRHEHVHKIIKPAMEKGLWVICDRFSDSTFAYQGAGGNIDKDTLQSLNDIACQGLKPDLTVLLALDAEKRAKRNPKLDYYDQGKRSYEMRVSKSFDEMAQQEPDRFLVVDGGLPIEEVSEQIFACVQERFLGS